MQNNKTNKCYKSTTSAKLVAITNLGDNPKLLLYAFAKSYSLVTLFYDISNKYHIFQSLTPKYTQNYEC